MAPRITAIVPAAGQGTRFNRVIRKTFAEIHGLPLLVHSLRRLHSEEMISEIIPVLREEDMEKGYGLAKSYGLEKITRIARGGRERQDSVKNALDLLEGDGLVVIHDGARPFFPENTIERLVDGLRNADGVVPAVKSQDTLKEVTTDGTVVATVDRDRVRAIQTPQLFRLGTIRKAYERACGSNEYATDDAALVESMGGRVAVIPGSPMNIKVTTGDDLAMMEHILAAEGKAVKGTAR